MNRGSIRAHLESKIHRDAIQKHELDQNKRAALTKIQEADNAQLRKSQEQFMQLNPGPILLPKSGCATQSDSAGPNEEDMWNTFQFDDTIQVTAGRDTPGEDRARLEGQLDHLDGWDGNICSSQFSLEADFDETITNVMQNIGELTCL
jgi:hypothetical protein